jgi:hypothetical protein
MACSPARVFQRRELIDACLPEGEALVEGNISGDAADLLVGWDLVQKLGQPHCPS